MASAIHGAGLRRLAISLILLPGFLPASAEAYRRIEPGPKRISEEERAIVEDPALGIEGAVVLVEETDLDESDPLYAKTTYHLRAKILSNAGRPLANIEVPWNPSDGYLLRWWARTLLPDGSVQDLRLSELGTMSLVRTRGFQSQVRRGTLKGVAPGCVIDYGYAVRNQGWSPMHVVPLAKPWPVRRFRYRWLPPPHLKVEGRLRAADGLGVTLKQERGLLTIAGSDLPPAPLRREEGGRPEPAAILTPVLEAVDAKEIADATARRLALTARRFSEGEEAREAVGGAVEAMQIPREAGLDAGLRAAYAWMAENLQVSREKAPEILVMGGTSTDWLVGRAGGGAHHVLARRAGGVRDLDYLFIALARALGAEAHLVIASPRKGLLPEGGDSITEPGFVDTVVAVRAPGEADAKAVFVDPGSGLPFGEVPWWIAPGKGLLATEGGGREVGLPPPDPKKSVAETRAAITYPGSSGSASATWSRTAGGQWGLLAKRYLDAATLSEREEWVDRMCGSGPDFDVTRSEAAGIASPSAGYRLACEGQRTAPGPRDDADELNLSFRGPWIVALPGKPDPAPKAPISLPFPYVDLLTVEVVSPEGFATAEPPESTLLEAPFARYHLRFLLTEVGYRVQRDFALLASRLDPEERERFVGFFEKVGRADASLLTFRRAGPQR